MLIPPSERFITVFDLPAVFNIPKLFLFDDRNRMMMRKGIFNLLIIVRN